MTSFLPVLLAVAVSQQDQGDACNFNTRLTTKLPTSIYWGELTLDGLQYIGASYDNNLVVQDIYRNTSTSHGSIGVDWYTLGVCPNGACVLFLGPTQGRIFSLPATVQETKQYPTSGGTLAAWNRDGSVVVIASDGSSTLTTWSKTGTQLNNLTLPDEIGTLKKVHGVCWSPGPLISVVVANSSGVTVVWFNEDGTPNSSHVVPQSWWVDAIDSVACNPNSTVAMSSLATMELGGKSYDLIEQSPVWDHHQHRYLACGSDACKLNELPAYSIDWVPVLELPEVSGHWPLGIFADRLITTFDDDVDVNGSVLFWWDVDTPQLNPKLNRPKDGGTGYGWLDKNTFLFAEKQADSTRVIYEWDVRKQQVGASYPLLNGSCVPGGGDGEFFSWAGNGTMTVFSQGGSQVLSWDTGARQSQQQFSCFNKYIWLIDSVDNTLFVWDNRGNMIKNNSLPVDNVISVAFYSSSCTAMITAEKNLYVWNFTDPPNPLLVDEEVVNTSWSPNGKWLVALKNLKSYTSTMFIYQSDRGYAEFKYVLTNLRFRYSQAIWSADSNWLVTLSPQQLISLTDVKETVKIPSAFDIDASQVFWNPVTMEVIFTTRGRSFQLDMWTPTPKVLSLVGGAGMRVGSTDLTVSVIGANLPTPRTSYSTMLRWVDFLNATPRCLRINATVIDTFTLSLGGVAIPDPSAYTVHIRYPTTHPTSPWLNSERSVAVLCAGQARPALTLENATKCVCPTYLYDTNATDSAIQCELCPIHATCNGTTIVASKEGYWPTKENQYFFLPCAAGACLADNKCADFHEGPLCGFCNSTSGQHGFGSCHKCNDVWVNVLLLIVGLICWSIYWILGTCFAVNRDFSLACLTAVKQGCSCCSSSKREKSETVVRQKGDESASVQLLATILSTVQMDQLLLQVDIKESLTSALGYTESATSAGLDTEVFSCLLIESGWAPGHMHFVKIMTMLLLPNIALGLLLILNKRHRDKFSNSNVITGAIVAWTTVQPNITLLLFQTLSCKFVNSIIFDWRLKHDLSVRCQGQLYWVFFGVVLVPVLILIVMVVPAFIVWILRGEPFQPFGLVSSRSSLAVNSPIDLPVPVSLDSRVDLASPVDRDSNEDPDSSEDPDSPEDPDSSPLAFLWRSYRAKFWYLVVFYRKVVLAAVVTITRNPFHVAVTLLFAGVLHIVVWPSNRTVVNAAEVISLMVGAFIFAATAGVISFGPKDQISAWQLLIVGIVSHCVLVGLLVYEECRWRGWCKCMQKPCRLCACLPKQSLCPCWTQSPAKTEMLNPELSKRLLPDAKLKAKTK